MKVSYLLHREGISTLTKETASVVIYYREALRSLTQVLWYLWIAEGSIVNEMK